MVAFVCAFIDEARILIDALKLKKRDAEFPIFESEEYLLILSGLGKMRSAIATTYLLAKYDVECIINFGIAATSEREHKIGEMFQINKIVDSDTADELYPDMLLDIGVKERGIYSASKPMDSINEGKHLIDMESYGFAKAAFEFLSPHRVFLFKVVSDYCEPTTITKELVLEICKNGSERLLEILPAFDSLKESGEILSCEEVQILERVAKKHRFSHSQEKQIVELAKYTKLKNSSFDFACLARIDEGRRDVIFQKVCSDLS